MNDKNCQQCNQSNAPEMSFCINCGAEFSHISMDEPPPTVMGGNFDAFTQGGQNFQQPNFQSPQPNFQQPNFQPQQPNFQQPNFQQPNFQQPNFQNAPAESGGNMTKILVGIGGAFIGLILLFAGGVQLYKVFRGSSSSTSTSQNLYPNNVNVANTNSVKSSNTNIAKPSNMNSGSVSNSNSTSSSKTIADLTQEKVGDWTLRDTITGDPEKDGFSGASEEKQFKYYNSSGAMVHLTLAEYPSAYEAQKGLRTSMQKFKTLKLKVSEEGGAQDNNGNEIGITQTMASANGKIYARYWTNKNFLFRALGTETDAENFFRKSEN